MNASDPLGIHAGQYQNNYTQEETNQFSAAFNEITQGFVAAMADKLDPGDEAVQALVASHYAFVSKFWKPTREAYKNLAMSYLLPTPYRDTYESIAAGLGGYHYRAIVIWADTNL